MSQSSAAAVVIDCCARIGSAEGTTSIWNLTGELNEAQKLVNEEVYRSLPPDECDAK